MQLNPRIQTTIVTFISLGIKFLFPIGLAYYATDKDFSFLLITYNLILTCGYIFSLEHHTFYHRKAIHKQRIENIEFYERVYFDQTLLIKLLIVILTLLFFKNFTILQRILVFFIAFLDLHLIENSRKFVAKGNYLRGTLINTSRVSLPILFFFIIFFIIQKVYLEFIIISILISFLLIKYFYDIRICNIFNLRIKKDLFLKITYRTRQFAFISIFGILTPFLDKLILLNYQQYNMIQTITLWSIVGNLISIFLYENINKPYQVEVINFISRNKFRKMINMLSIALITLIFVFLFALKVVKFPFALILNPSIEFNSFQIISCVLLTACNPINSLLDMSIYGYKRDNLILIFTLIEFFVRYLATIASVLFLDTFYLPYILGLSNLTYIFLKYLYFKKIIYGDSLEYTGL